MTGAEADDRLRRGRRHAGSRRGRPARGLAEHAQDGRLEQPEAPVASPDPQHHLAGAEGVAVVERLDQDLVIGGRVGQHMREQDLGFVDAAQHARLSREHLHHHDRVEALAGEDLVRAREVDVRRITRQDARRWRPTLPHRTVHGTAATPSIPRAAGGRPSVAAGHDG